VETMVIEVPAELKEIVKPIAALIANSQRRLAKAADGRAVDYGEVEREVAGEVAAIERAIHRQQLAALDVDEPRVLIGGRGHVRVGRYPATYYTPVGEVQVLRSIYRPADERNGKTVDAISVRAGVVADGWLPQTARAIARLVESMPSREAEAVASEMGRLPYSRTSMERVAHGVGEHYVACHVEIGGQLIKDFKLPRAAASVSIGIDRVSMPMEEPRPRPAGRPRKGAAKRPVTVAYRMAYVGTVTLHDREGNALHTIRHACMPDGDAKQLCRTMASDVLVLLEKRPRLAVTLLSDGAHEMVDLLATEVATRLGVDSVQLVDFWHLVEKLAPAAQVISADEASALLARWKLRMLNTEYAAVDILGELAASGLEHRRVGNTQPVHEAMTYIDNHRLCMNYAAARARGLPIGSGTVEATCKTLVSVRMKRAGSRWKTETGNHVLQLRALALSDRWSDGMDLTLRPLRKAVRAAA